MNRVEFVRVNPHEYDADGSIDILIDGKPLTELARQAELPFAAADGNPELAGSYGPLWFGTDDAARANYMGEQVYSWFDDGDTVLLGCPGCGEWGCWPLTAVVTLDARRVEWRGFRTGHRSWDLSALGPFVFDQRQYVDAVNRLTT